MTDYYSAINVLHLFHVVTYSHMPQKSKCGRSLNRPICGNVTNTREKWVDKHGECFHFRSEKCCILWQSVGVPMLQLSRISLSLTISTGLIFRIVYKKCRLTKQQSSISGSSHQLSCGFVALHTLCKILNNSSVQLSNDADLQNRWVDIFRQDSLNNNRVVAYVQYLEECDLPKMVQFPIFPHQYM